jgi:hypothetical protein
MKTITSKEFRTAPCPSAGSAAEQFITEDEMLVIIYFLKLFYFFSYQCLDRIIVDQIETTRIILILICNILLICIKYFFSFKLIFIYFKLKGIDVLKENISQPRKKKIF